MLRVLQLFLCLLGWDETFPFKKLSLSRWSRKKSLNKIIFIGFSFRINSLPSRDCSVENLSKIIIELAMWGESQKD